MNLIYFFTGTGNSLSATKQIAARLGNCEIAAIHKSANTTIPAGLERVGFVFPVYGWGLPLMVKAFLRETNFSDKPYVFAIATMGGLSGNSLPQVGRILQTRGIEPDYAASLAMVRNSVTNYNMTENPEPVLTKASKRLDTFIAEIERKSRKPCRKGNGLIERLHESYVSKLPVRGASYTVSDDCVACGICATVCPAENITLDGGKPALGTACEGCVACIQFCPKRAINCGKTAERRRYTNPQATQNELTEYYSKK